MLSLSFKYSWDTRELENKYPIVGTSYSVEKFITMVKEGDVWMDVYNSDGHAIILACRSLSTQMTIDGRRARLYGWYAYTATYYPMGETLELFERKLGEAPGYFSVGIAGEKQFIYLGTIEDLGLSPRVASLQSLSWDTRIPMPLPFEDVELTLDVSRKYEDHGASYWSEDRIDYGNFSETLPLSKILQQEDLSDIEYWSYPDAIDAIKDWLNLHDEWVENTWEKDGSDYGERVYDSDGDEVTYSDFKEFEIRPPNGMTKAEFFKMFIEKAISFRDSQKQ